MAHHPLCVLVALDEISKIKEKAQFVFSATQVALFIAYVRAVLHINSCQLQ